VFGFLGSRQKRSLKSSFCSQTHVPPVSEEAIRLYSTEVGKAKLTLDDGSVDGDDVGHCKERRETSSDFRQEPVSLDLKVNVLRCEGRGAIPGAM
jgi:hypothetical protein